MVDRVLTVTLAAQVNNYLANFQKVREANQKVTKSAEDALAAYERQNQAMEFMGSRLLTVGAVATAAGALAVKAAIDWESAWAGVTKTVDGTPEQLAEVEEGLRGLARVLPSTHEEIAAVAEAAGQLGVSRGNIVAFTRTMIDLSETTNLTADEAATSIAQLMNVMQTAPDDVDNLGAALVALGNDGASTERDIIQMAQRIAGAGRIVGLTEGQVLAFANALASVGIEAEAGGSAISRVMTDIAMAVSAGGEELDKFASVAGMSSKDFQKAFKDDPADAIATFIEGLARIDAQGGDVFATLSELGQTDIRVSQALLGMANSGDLLRKSLKLGSEAWEENTALAEEAAKRYETTEAKLQIAGNAARDAAIDYGTYFLPVVSAVSEAVATLAGGFSDLPEPIQGAVVGVVTLATVATIAGGAFLLAVPKVAAFTTQLAILRTSEIPAVARAANVATGAIGRTAAGFSSAARFLTGPWGIALVAAAVGVQVLENALDSLRASSEEMQNSLSTASTAAEIFQTAGRGQEATWWRDVTGDLQDLDAVLDKSADQWTNWWKRLGDSSNFGAQDALGKVGKELASLANSDLPSAQRAFSLLAEETNGSETQLWRLLSLMPDYRDALIAEATAQGINVSSMDEAERKQTLLNLAVKQAESPAREAATAYKDAAAEAKALTDEVLSLVEAVNEANGVGQDAVTANARYQESLAGISTEMEKQRQEYLEPQKQAYEELHGSLDGFVGDLSGFVASLDESTAAGSANAAMLAQVAGDAEKAAGAQYELDLKTMSAKDATEKYASTLAAQRQAFVDSATAAGFNADEVQVLADKVFALPTERSIAILADTAAATVGVENLITSIKNRSATLTVKVQAAAAGGASDRTLANMLGIGGFAGGGRIPGPPSRKDNRLAAVATGEFITNAEATARNISVLEHINAGGVIQGYSNGGYVQPRYIDPTPYRSPSRAGSGDTDLAWLRQDIRELAKRPVKVYLDGQVVADSSNGANKWEGT